MQSHANLNTKIVLVERGRQQPQSRKARRIVAVVCALAALALICAGAAIVSHARTASSAVRHQTNGPEEQGGAEFSELEHGGLGS
jgi:hypothetical protein